MRKHNQLQVCDVTNGLHHQVNIWPRHCLWLTVTSETRPECKREEAEAEGDAAKGTTVFTGERRGEKRRFSALQVSRQCPFVLLVKVDD